MWTTGKIIGTGKVERAKLPRSTPTALPVSGFEHISTIIQRTVNDMRVKLKGSRGRYKCNTCCVKNNATQPTVDEEEIIIERRGENTK
jgi:hypothetical protein